MRVMKQFFNFDEPSMFTGRLVISIVVAIIMCASIVQYVDTGTITDSASYGRAWIVAGVVALASCVWRAVEMLWEKLGS